MGLVLGSLMAESRTVEKLLMPYAFALQSLPKVAIAPLIVIWFGFGDGSKVAIYALLAFFPVLINSFTGLRATEPEKIDLMRSLSASRPVGHCPAARGDRHAGLLRHGLWGDRRCRHSTRHAASPREFADDWRPVPDGAAAALYDRPAMLVGFGRSTAKASTFLLADPKAGARAFLKMYPEIAPRGSTEEQGVKAVLEAISRRIKLYEPPYPNTKMGQINPAELITEAKMNSLQIKDVSQNYTNDIIGEIYDFDAAKIRAGAATY